MIIGVDSVSTQVISIIERLMDRVRKEAIVDEDDETGQSGLDLMRVFRRIDIDRSGVVPQHEIDKNMWGV